MGYTHYWSQAANVTPADWIEFAEGAERLFAIVGAEGVVLRDWNGEKGKPKVNGSSIAFNGDGDQSHESFVVTRKVDEGFCKTARKDYDTTVAALLCYLDSITPYAYATRSDGALWNYRDGLDLAKRAWPQKANQLDFPRSLKEKARWKSKEEWGNDDYQIVVGLDEITYIEHKPTLALRRLPDEMQGVAYGSWVRDLPDTMRKWGRFTVGEYDACEALRLTYVWGLSESNPVAPVIYDPIVHGLRHPELTSAQTY